MILWPFFITVTLCDRKIFVEDLTLADVGYFLKLFIWLLFSKCKFRERVGHNHDKLYQICVEVMLWLSVTTKFLLKIQLLQMWAIFFTLLIGSCFLIENLESAWAASMMSYSIPNLCWSDIVTLCDCQVFVEDSTLADVGYFFTLFIWLLFSKWKFKRTPWSCIQMASGATRLYHMNSC
jgi:uncharacterized membrane protein YiaA